MINVAETAVKCGLRPKLQVLPVYGRHLEFRFGLAMNVLAIVSGDFAVLKNTRTVIIFALFCQLQIWKR